MAPINYKGYEIEMVKDRYLVEGLLFDTLRNAKWYASQVMEDGTAHGLTTYAMTAQWEQFDGEVYVHNRGWVAAWSGLPLESGARPFFGP